MGASTRYRVCTGRPATSVMFSFISRPANIHELASEIFFFVRGDIDNNTHSSLLFHDPRFFFYTVSSFRRRVGPLIFGASVMWSWTLFFAIIPDREHTEKHRVNETRLNIVDLNLAKHVSFTIYVIIIFLLFYRINTKINNL